MLESAVYDVAVCVNNTEIFGRRPEVAGYECLQLQADALLGSPYLVGIVGALHFLLVSLGKYLVEKGARNLVVPVEVREGLVLREQCLTVL